MLVDKWTEAASSASQSECRAVDCGSDIGRHARRPRRRRRLSTALRTAGSVRTAALDAVHGVEHGGVVAPADAAPDLGQAVLGELARQVHRHLAGDGHRGPAVAGEQRVALARRTPAPPRRRSPRGRRRRATCPRPAGAARGARAPGVGSLALQRRVGHHADQRALERAHAAVDALRDLRRARRRTPRRRRGGRAWRGWLGARRPAAARARPRARRGSARPGAPRGPAAPRGCDRR